MPELPEVETIRRDLQREVLGLSFRECSLPWPKALRHPSPQEFARRIHGQRIQAITRRGKYLLLHLSRGDLLLFHLMMGGQLLLRSQEATIEKHACALLNLNDGRQLRLADQRKFAHLELVAEPPPALGKLGPEPLEEDFTPQLLAERLRGRSAPLKALLLDQGFIAGIGNIYADEALFEARLHPTRGARTLSPEEVERLHSAIKLVLIRGIGNRGTTFQHYRDASGEPGLNQEELRVYRRLGLPCPRCATPIQRLRLRGRGSHLCPRCQPEKPK